MDVRAIVFSVLNLCFSNPVDHEFDGEEKLEQDLEADSLDMIEIAMELEDRLGVEVPDEVIERVETVNDLTAECQKLVDAK